MNEEEINSYRERIVSRKSEMYQEYISEMLTLVFSDEAKEKFNNVIRYKVEDDYKGPIDKKTFVKSFFHDITGEIPYYYKLGNFNEGYATIDFGIGARKNYIAKNGKLLFGKYNMFNLKYNNEHIARLYHGEDSSSTLYDVNEGFALIKRNSYSDPSYYFFVQVDGGPYRNKKDDPLFDEYRYQPKLAECYKKARPFREGYAAVVIKDKWNLIDHSKRKVFPKGYTFVSDVEFGRVKLRDGLKTIVFYIGLPNYQVKKNRDIFICTSVDDNIEMEYQPVRMYYKNGILCTDYHNYYYYDRINNRYITIGDVKDVVYDEVFVYNRKTKRVYLPYNNSISDITEYYIKNLINKETIRINRDVSSLKLISFSDYDFINMEDISKMMQVEKEKHKEFLKQRNEEKFRLEIKRLKEQARIEEEECRRKELEGYRKIREGIELIKSSKKRDISKRPPLFNIEFEKVGDHLEIPEYLIEVLSLYDISHISFNNVKISGIDFRGCNIHLVPREVYNKDLRGCNFEGLHIGPFMDFTGVDIRGARFSDDDDPLTVDYLSMTFKDAIYDETTLYNGRPLCESLNVKQENRKI